MNSGNSSGEAHVLLLNQFKTGSKPVHPEISSLKHVHTLQKELCSIEWAALRGNLIAQGY
jgi:hypothetical protein